MASNAKNRNLISEDLFVTGNFVPKNAFINSVDEFFDEYGKKWPLWCMESQWLFKNPWSARDPEELDEPSMRSWSLSHQPLHALCKGPLGFMNGCSARNARLATGTPMTMGLSLNRAIRRRSYYAIQNRWHLYYPEYLLARTTHQRVFARTKLVIGSQDLVFWEFDKETSLYPEKMWRVANHRLLLYETDLGVGCGRRKTMHHWWPGSGMIYLDDQHVATQYQTEIGENLLLSKGKESTWI